MVIVQHSLDRAAHATNKALDEARADRSGRVRAAQARIWLDALRCAGLRIADLIDADNNPKGPEQ